MTDVIEDVILENAGSMSTRDKCITSKRRQSYEYGTFLTAKETKPQDEQVPEMDKSPIPHKDTLCGVLSWRPHCLQKLTHHRFFAAVFIIIATVQLMILPYFIGVLTTLEKAFGIPSRKMGFVLSGNDISQILCGVLVTYVARHGSRPTWMAVGMLMTTASCFVFASAQLLWDGSASLSSTSAFSTHWFHSLCPSDSAEFSGSNRSLVEKSCPDDSSQTFVMAILFSGQLLSGIGNATVYTLGLTYLDDSVKRRDSPLYLAMADGLRSLGPSLGFLMASYFLNIYISPQERPEYIRQDPRWLGAWWLGFLIIATSQLVIMVPLLLFPKKLPTRCHNKHLKCKRTDDEHQQEGVPESPSINDCIATIGRIIKNPLILLHILSNGPQFFGTIGYSTFLPKYLEANFGQTSSQSALVTGTAGTLIMVAGVFVGGLIIWKFKPRAFYICFTSGIVDVIYVFGLIVMMTFKCDNGSFVGVNFVDGRAVTSPSCSQKCDCALQFDPVCLGSQNYLSPCLAGCTEMEISAHNETLYQNCSCFQHSLEKEFNSTFVGKSMMAQMGYCPGSRSNCDHFWHYISILAFLKFVIAATKAGDILVFMRVKQQDKSVAMALCTNVFGLLVFIPAPILYGVLADSLCLISEVTPCGLKGNCWLYDLDGLRRWYHGLTIACLSVAGMFEFTLSVYARKLDLYANDPLL